MKGGKNAKWIDEEMADYFLIKVKDFVLINKNRPFFLYFGLHQPHVPRTPNERFVGATSMGPRGDAIIEADWCVGQVINFLKELDILENTIIIFSSDNGPVLDDGYKDEAVEKIGNHDPKGGLRGGKYSLFDAGTHVPFFVYWKGKINPVVSYALVCQVDLLASFSDLLNYPLKEDDFDSQDLLSVFLGKSQKGRSNLVIEAQGKLAIRQENWVMIPPYNGPKNNITGNELGNEPFFSLYDLAKDKSQAKNVAQQFPNKLEELKSCFFSLTSGYYKKDVQEIELK
jgi:arylsulfatase A-like enzyme